MKNGHYSNFFYRFASGVNQIFISLIHKIHKRALLPHCLTHNMIENVPCATTMIS